MNKPRNTIFRKTLLSAMTSVVLLGSIPPVSVFAEEGSQDLSTHSIEEGLEEIQSDADVDSEALTEELNESNDQETDNLENSLEEKVEALVEPAELKIYDHFSEFLHNFNQLSDAEIMEHIERMDLYVDDEGIIHSFYEKVEEELDEFRPQDYQELAEYLETILKDNLLKLEQNQLEINMDLNQEDISLDQFDFSQFNRQSQSVMTSSTTRVRRLHGSNRFETATSISRSGWSRASTVIIVDANGFADALAGAPLARALDAPILLAGNSGGNAETLKEIDRLGASRAIILGGEQAVPSTIESSLRSRNISVERIAGSNRYETAKLISDRVVSLTGAKRAVLVSGEDFADAMSVAPFAAREGMPIYLTRRRTLSPEVREASNRIKDWTIIGGGAAVSGTTGRDLANRVQSVNRIEGTDRYQTNHRVIRHFGISGDHAYVATGIDFMDALTGSVLAAKNATGVLLVRNNEDILQRTVDFAQRQRLGQLTIFGGLAALNERVEETLRNNRLPNAKPLVYIDPGHGGKDPGAQFAGVRESDLVLTMSLLLRDMLVASGNYDVVMARETDRYLTMGERSSEANRLNADILVSVHVNAMGGPLAGLARGIETFIYHPTYETRQANFRTEDYRIRESLRLAIAVQGRLMQRTTLQNRGVRGANLHMVREPNMPAILPELGFINNPLDLAIITTPTFQQNAARAIKEGIDLYFGN